MTVFSGRSEMAIQNLSRMAAKDAVLVGISSGAAVYAALNVARRMGKKNTGHCGDGADKYMSN